MRKYIISTIIIVFVAFSFVFAYVSSVENHYEYVNQQLKNQVSDLQSKNLQLSSDNILLSNQNKSLTNSLGVISSVYQQQTDLISAKNQEITQLRQTLTKTPLGYVAWKGGQMQYDEAEIAKLIRIVLAESEGDPKQITYSSGGNVACYGLFQINGIHTQYKTTDLLTIPGNVNAAFKLYESQGTTPWVSSQHNWDIN